MYIYICVCILIYTCIDDGNMMIYIYYIYNNQI